MIDNKMLTGFLFTTRNVYCYFKESPQRNDSSKYPQCMFLGVLNTIFLNISHYLSHIELKIRSFQSVVIKGSIVISHVGIKRVGCNMLITVPRSIKCWHYSNIDTSKFSAKYESVHQ